MLYPTRSALLFSLLASIVRATPYQFNAVAVTGGGYVDGIIAHPTEKNLMYARSDIGSSYRWSQELNKWIPLTDFVSGEDSNLFGTETLALDPTNPECLYLAQGRYLTSNESAFFVSEDRGETFNIYPAPFPMGSNELGRNNGERLAVDPFQPDHLWMGTRTEGLWKSEDRAQTWTNVTSFPNAFANTIGIVFVIFDPASNGTIYAGATAPEGLYRSTDHGSTWQKLPNQPSSWAGTYIPANETQPQSIAPQPMKAALSTSGVLYITYGDFPGPYGTDYGAVYKYDTKSEEWTNITPDGTNSKPAPYTPQAFPAGGFCGISLDAHDPETVVVVSLDREGPAIDSMYLSRDGGSSWKDVSQLSTPDPRSVDGYWGHPIAQAALNNGTPVPWLSFDYSPSWGGYGAPDPIYGLARFGWWMAAVMLSPWNTGELLYATGATVWASNDVIAAADEMKSPTWYVQAQGIEETVCLAMISPTQGPHLFSGFGDINGFRHEDLDVPQPMFGLPVFSNLVSLDWAGQNPSLIVRVGSNGLNNTAETGCHQAAYSEDTGVEWTTFPTCIPPINETSTDSGTIAVDASGKHFIWAAASTALQGTPPAVASPSGPYWTKDMGKTWHSPIGLEMQTPNISADRVQPSTFYSFTNGSWHTSTDGGASYVSHAASAIGLPASAVGTLPVVDFSKAGHIYLPLSGHGIYYSTNFGTSWKMVSSADAALFTVGAPKPGSSVPALFLWGTVPNAIATGLYRSDDNGKSWARVDDAAHQYGGLVLIQGDARVYGRVYLGTSGRGIVRADLDESAPHGVNLPGTGGI